MIRSTLALVVLIAIAAFIYIGAYKTDSRAHITLGVSIVANDTNAYGQPWDGIQMGGIYGRIMPDLPTKSPPDIVLCIIDLKSSGPDMNCQQKGSADEPESICHDSFECDFTPQVPRKASFAILTYDLDGVFGVDRNDLIDVILVSNDDKKLAELSEAAKQAASLIARTDIDIPPWISSWATKNLGNRMPKWLKAIAERGSFEIKPSEAKRRETPYKIFKTGDCKDGCRLSQSTIKIDWSDLNLR
jgi:hypothetical protein